jgi:hypothetical protein
LKKVASAVEDADRCLPAIPLSTRAGFPHGRIQAVLNNDAFQEKSKNPGTNTPFAEVMFPLSLTDMLLIKP